ncbi:MAG: GHKL domain-containing protein [Oscillospiraceae bacterium]|nr:GHKL domain-containing protein [Oscillospiraceae bacterium]
MNNVLISVLSILTSVLGMFSRMIFFNACLGKNIRLDKRLFGMVYVIAGIVDVALSQFGFFPQFYMVKSVIILYLLSLMHEAKLSARIFAIASNMIFAMISELLGYGIILRTMPGINEEYYPHCSLIIAVFIEFIFTVIIALIMKHRAGKAGLSDYIRLMVTPLVSIAVLVAISIEYDAEQPNATAGVCIVGVGLLVINLVVYYLFENIIEVNEIREKQRRMEQQFRYQEEKYRQASRSFKNISSVIHDTNKHLVYLGGCMENGDYDEAKRYIAYASERLDRSYKRVNTGYLPVDALVSNALSSAEGDNIGFKTDIRIEKDSVTVERYDLCVALGNLLDNALEACRTVKDLDDRYIDVSIITADGSLIINIKNAAEKAEGDQLSSSKENKLLHGYGLSNIKAIAEKYSGVFTIERREFSCEATLILPL